jgi:uncharacterized RDD family membrane protein YckC
MNAPATNIAGAGKRILGGFVDLFLTWLVIVVVGAFAGFGGNELEEGQVGVSYSVSVTGWPMVLMALGVFLLFALMEWRLGRTPGKMVAGTRVVMADGRPVTLGAALVRNVLRIVDAIGLYLVGLIVLAIDGQNRRIGDFAAGTRVVNDAGR